MTTPTEPAVSGSLGLTTPTEAPAVSGSLG
jgi:hypothetical protein